MQLFRLAIARQFLQPPYLVIPDDDALIGDRKLLWGKRFCHDPARPLRETVERAAARVVCIPAPAAHEDAVDAGGKLRRIAAEEAEADQSAQKTAHECLRG